MYLKDLLFIIFISIALVILGFSMIKSDRDRYEAICKSHGLEYVDWNTRLISCSDPKTHVVKVIKNES